MVFEDVAESSYEGSFSGGQYGSDWTPEEFLRAEVCALPLIRFVDAFQAWSWWVICSWSTYTLRAQITLQMSRPDLFRLIRLNHHTRTLRQYVSRNFSLVGSCRPSVYQRLCGAGRNVNGIRYLSQTYLSELNISKKYPSCTILVVSKVFIMSVLYSYHTKHISIFSILCHMYIQAISQLPTREIPSEAQQSSVHD